MANNEQAAKDAQLMAAIFEYSLDAIIGSTLDAIVTSWSPAATTMYGYSSKEIIGRSANVLVPDDRTGEFLASLATVKLGKVVGRFETVRVRKNGSLVPVSITVGPVHDENGPIVGVSAIHRDVTEQRRAFELAQRMQAIVDSSDDAIISRTLEGIITSWNPAAEKIYGYTSEEVVGKSIDLLTPKGQVAEAQAFVAKVSAGQHVERLETIRIRKDGTVFPASITISAIRDSDGAIVGVSAIHRDVTKERRAFELAQRMEAIVDSSDDAIIAITLGGIITSWNRAAERLFGYTSEEIIGKPAETVTPNNLPDEMQTILARVRAGEHIEHLETIRVRKDGTVFPVSLTVSPIFDADGATIGISMISRDMAKLIHAARYARSLIEAALDPMATISPDGKITDVNEAAVKVTGVPRDALIGTQFAQYCTDPNQALQGYARTFAQGSLSDFPLTLVHRDGTLTDVLCNASVYRDFNGNVLGLLAVARDASQLRRQQELSEQLQHALNSRIVIEQAKGIIAQRHGVTIEQAYQRIRGHARSKNASLREVAEAIVQVGLQV